MNTVHTIITDVTLQEWYLQHYEKCLAKYGPESMITRGYKDVLDRINSADVEEKTLQVHYPSDHSRPLDTSR
jgi:hypothetical protein